jgi:hypothetical protein
MIPWLFIGFALGVITSMAAATLQDYWRNH